VTLAKENHATPLEVSRRVAGEHPGVLLRHPDRGHPGPAGRGLRLQVGPHPLDLAIGLAEPHHRDVLVVREPGDRVPKRCPDLLQDRRGGDWITQVLGQEADDLPSDLQARHIRVEVDPIQALQIQHHLPVENIVDRHRRGHDGSLAAQVSPGPAVSVGLRSQQPAAAATPPRRPPARRSEAKPH
jgi:hypothetical protein